MMPTPTGEGPSLISWIHHLQSLLQNLPLTLPLNPIESTYHFCLDAEHVDDDALNWNLEICFEIHKLQKEEAIIFQERGDRYKDLIKTMKTTVKALPTSNHVFFAKCGLSGWSQQQNSRVLRCPLSMPIITSWDDALTNSMFCVVSKRSLPRMSVSLRPGSVSLTSGHAPHCMIQ